MTWENVVNRIMEKEGERCSFKEGDLVIKQDTHPNKLYLIKTGTVKAFHVNEKGQEFLLAVMGSKEIFGELEFFTKTNYMASVKCISDCEMIKFSYEEFEQLLKNETGLLLNLCSKLANRLLLISQRTLAHSYYSLEYLISKYLMNEYFSRSKSEIEISKENLASYFGTNLRSVNRILKKLSDENIILVDKNQIKILSEAKLAVNLKSAS